MKTESSTINGYLLMEKQAKYAYAQDLMKSKNVLLDKIMELKLHAFVKNEQYNTYNCLRNEMPDNAMLVHIDYSERHENKQ